MTDPTALIVWTYAALGCALSLWLWHTEWQSRPEPRRWNADDLVFHEGVVLLWPCILWVMFKAWRTRDQWPRRAYVNPKGRP